MLTKHFSILCALLWLALFSLLASLCLAPPFRGWGTALARSGKLVIVAFLLYYLLLSVLYAKMAHGLERKAWGSSYSAPWYSFLAFCMSKSGWGFSLLFVGLWFANDSMANMARSEFVRNVYANVTPIPDSAILNQEIIQWLISGELVLFSLASAIYLARTIAQDHRDKREDKGTV